MKGWRPTEANTDEHWVALTPIGVRELAERGHQALLGPIQRGLNAPAGETVRAR